MTTTRGLPPDGLLGLIKAGADATRLRILLLLAAGELNVTDLTRVLGQSQPRVSRHLRLLVEAGLIERFRDGSWVFVHLAEQGPGRELVDVLLRLADPAAIETRRDRTKAAAIKRARAEGAQEYFERHAADWDRIRALHVAEGEVEAAMLELLPGPFGLFLDLGTGTGRVLELFAHRYRRGLGLDLNERMLALARGRLAARGHAHAQVRHGDLYRLSVGDGSAGAVVMHQVLHFLAEPQAALREAARVLVPDGRLLIVDFAPHGLEFLREQFAHQRLGFPPAQIAQWLAECDLDVRSPIELAPPPGGERLTVLLVEARRRPSARRIARETALTMEGDRA